MAETTIFDALNAINKKIPTYKYNKKKASAYMLLMWMSHSHSCLDKIEKMNEHLFETPDEVIFAALYKGISKDNRFIKWDKGVKDKKLTKKKESIIQELKDEYGFSDFEAQTIFKLYIDR